MNAILIDPFARSVSEVDYTGGIEQIYKLIDCDTFDVARINDLGDGIYIDDNGLINGKEQAFFAVKGKALDYHQPLAGKGLVLGCDADGNSIEPKVTLAQVKASVRFCDAKGRPVVDAGDYVISTMPLRSITVDNGRVTMYSTIFDGSYGFAKSIKAKNVAEIEAELEAFCKEREPSGLPLIVSVRAARNLKRKCAGFDKEARYGKLKIRFLNADASPEKAMA